MGGGLLLYLGTIYVFLSRLYFAGEIKIFPRNILIFKTPCLLSIFWFRNFSQCSTLFHWPEHMAPPGEENFSASENNLQLRYKWVSWWDSELSRDQRGRYTENLSEMRWEILKLLLPGPSLWGFTGSYANTNMFLSWKWYLSCLLPNVMLEKINKRDEITLNPSSKKYLCT